MLAELLPLQARFHELSSDPVDAILLAEEEATIGRAVESRRQEFATGRHCARHALRQLGLNGAAIGRLAGGGPAWPAGVVGSITHCTGYRAAAVARRSELLSIGIDAEPAEALPEGVLELISSPPERRRIASLSLAWPAVAWDRLLFSAKEAVYKTWWPLTRSFLDFDEADIDLDAVSATFRARLLVPSPGPLESGELTGRFVVQDGLIVTAIVIPATITNRAGIR